MSSSSSAKSGAYGTAAQDTNFRRTWDREEFERRARERAREEREKEDEEERKRKGLPPRPRRGPPNPPRELLRARTEKVALDTKLNKTEVVQAVGVASKTPGFFCQVCDCVLKDSKNYLDHINGKKREFVKLPRGQPRLSDASGPAAFVAMRIALELMVLVVAPPPPSLPPLPAMSDVRALGMSMRVERNTAEQIKEKLESLKKKKEEGPPKAYDIDERVQELQAAEEEERRQKKERKKLKKEEERRKAEEERKKEGLGDDEEAMLAMGCVPAVRRGERF
ncbi:MAG: hypothetical protein BJ554DRAFT_7448 [Olpidium bornovanus]|uniref:U1-type domain-containing protein n=1 Tax=Olpidium bornovanus TaxID=278681 RepID=A0A8H7ZW18_9FUNG|nr:MAG: hypothetical protein BJ554DRAFT_7448 [Olpidium bornovanus]